MQPPLHLSQLGPEQQAVWRRVVKLWDLAISKDEARIRDALHPSYIGWDMSAPLPHDRETAVKSVCGSSSELLEYKLEPLGIEVYEGSTAVVHYRYQARLSAKVSKTFHVTGKWTEVYVKQEGTWLMAAVSGRPDPPGTAPAESAG